MNSDRRVAWMIGALTLGWSACFHHTRDWNSASRLLLTHALVEDRTIDVTRFVAIDGRLVRNPPTRDLASPDRLHYFSDKAPGQSYFGAAALGLLRAAGVTEDHPSASDFVASQPEKLSLRRTDWLLTVATSGLAAAGSSVLVFLLLRQWQASQSVAAATALALAFASPMQVYATLYYGHVLAGFFSMLAMFLVESQGDRPLGRNFLAGLAGGLSVVVEYTMATFVVAIAIAGGLSLFQHGRNGRQSAAAGLAFVLGGLGPAILLGWYHWCATGDPFTPAYRYEIQLDFAAVHAKSGGIPLSSMQPGAIAGLLVGSSIGLLWFAPAVLWAVPGMLSLLRFRPRACGTILLATILLVLAIACFPNWNGGLATGPRFLVPILPLLFVAVGWAWHVFSKATFGLASLGVFAPVVVGSAVLNVAMNAAGGRKPFDMSIGEYLISVSQGHDRHIVDWATGLLGVRLGFESSLAILLVLMAVVVALVLRHSKSETQAV
jgi:hypothetical protein